MQLRSEERGEGRLRGTGHKKLYILPRALRAGAGQKLVCRGVRVKVVRMQIINKLTFSLHSCRRRAPAPVLH